MNKRENAKKLLTHYLIVAQAFIAGYKKGDSVILKDGNIHNCSVRQCAKALNCSYQTLSDYLNGKVKNSVLEGVEVCYG